MNDSQFSWKKRAMAFVYAWKGLKALFRYEHNARIHLVAAVAAIAMGIWLKISAVEWCLIAIVIASVISAEALNSAVEALADRISTEKHPLLGRAKDLGAAAVTLLALMAIIVGCIIFIPKLYLLL
ncbi:MAG: diacylglycerol kinase [Muribaculaceae bacterium]|nr:diacylglycerol kinase [Muribaculaceae bacterium]